MCRGADQMRVFEQFQQTCINGVDVDELLAIARSASCGFESCQAHKMADPTASDGVYPITSADGTSCERERADSLGLAWLPLHYLESLELRTALVVRSNRHGVLRYDDIRRWLGAGAEGILVRERFYLCVPVCPV